MGATPAFGDGVAYRLPADGSWVMYRLDWIEAGDNFTYRPDGKGGTVEEKFDRGTIVKMAKEQGNNSERLFLVRSVGRVEDEGEWLRWIELVDNPKEERAEKPKERQITIKVLIPERYFVAGEDPGQLRRNL